MAFTLLAKYLTCTTEYLAVSQRISKFAKVKTSIHKKREFATGRSRASQRLPTHKTPR
jgi:hypothetical protein